MITYEKFVEIVTKYGFKIKPRYDRSDKVYIDMTIGDVAEPGYLVARFNTDTSCVTHWMGGPKEIQPCYISETGDFRTTKNLPRTEASSEKFEEHLKIFCDNWKKMKKKLRFRKIEEI